MEPVRLWLDDKRPAPHGWVHAKTAQEAIQFLAANEVTEASLDHDLGHCDACTKCKGYQSKCGCKCHWTGYSVVLWMASTGRWPKKKPTVHSANPAGSENMRATIERNFGTFIAFPRGEFRMSWKEQAHAEKFRKRHVKRCTRDDLPAGPSPTFSYKFTETGIGTGISISCSFCRRCRNITDYGGW